MPVIDVPLESWNLRPDGIIDAIVIHDSEGFSIKETLTWMAQRANRLSMHYVIDKDGTIYRCVAEGQRAWHAGFSNLHGRENVNNFSIGICLIDTGPEERFPDTQTFALLELCAAMCATYTIPLNRVVSHAAISPFRRTDPNNDFPWYDFLNTLGCLIVNDGR
jgi:N-acetylmuramoyl-L-alanine amidase